MLDLDAVVSNAALQGALTALVLHQAGCDNRRDALRALIRTDEDGSTRLASYSVIPLDADDETPFLVVAGRTMSPRNFADALGSVALPAYLVFDGAGRLLVRLDAPLSGDKLVERLAAVIEKAAPPVIAGRDAGLADSAWEERTEQEADASSAGTPSAIIVSSRSCSSCDALQRTAWSGRRTRVLLEYFDVQRLDLDSDAPFVAPDGRRTTEGMWLGKLGVVSAPAMIFLSPEGRVIGTVVERDPAIVVESMLEFVLTRIYRSHSSFSHFLQHRLEHLRRHGLDVGFLPTP